MRFEDLLYFRQVADEKSLTQAANSLFISQPSLSNAMKKLEKELGVTLFTRSQKGISLTADGEEFLTYANQILEQVDLLERRYSNTDQPLQIFNVASQHYAFVVDAFVRLLKKQDDVKYQASLKELRTFEVLEEVIKLKSEIGVLYKSNYNSRVLDKAFSDNNLSFTSLIKARPHVFIYRDHPLVDKDLISFEDLKPYPRLSYEQGHHNSYYYWEETFADYDVDKSIIVSDRATLFNLAIGLNGYTISSGIINEDLNGEDIVARRLDAEEEINIGYITNNYHTLSPVAEEFIEILKVCVHEGQH